MIPNRAFALHGAIPITATATFRTRSVFSPLPLNRSALNYLEFRHFSLAIRRLLSLIDFCS